MRARSDSRHTFRHVALFLLALPLAFLLGWATCGTWTWVTFGPDTNTPRDTLVDRYLPGYDVIERHELRVSAPASATWEALRAMDLQDAPAIRAILRGRELLMRAPGAPSPRAPIVEQTQAIGWRMLHELPGREVVMGAYTQPWEGQVTFHGLPPRDFAAFRDSGYVKIVWTLEAEPLDSLHSIARTETRVLATDPESRARFRRYWAQYSPGIILIRRIGLGEAKRRAESARR